jgi:predicted TIM-barrel fold metal-dependent hydrolase
LSNPYDGPIVDSHHHLWSAEAASHAWLDLAGNEEIPKIADVASYLAAMGRWRPAKTVWIEAVAADPFAEALAAQRIAGQHDFMCNAIVAHVPLDAPDVAARIAAMAASLPNLRGIRDIVAWRPGQSSFARHGHLLEDERFHLGLREIARAGLRFDLMLVPEQSAAACAMLAQLPDVPVCVEHAASPVLDDPGARDVWRASLAALARHRQVHIKVSALHCRLGTLPRSALRAAFLDIVAAFGCSRVMFGSDFPTHDRSCIAAESFDDFDAMTEGFPAHERQAMFYGNACRFYDI